MLRRRITSSRIEATRARYSSSPNGAIDSSLGRLWLHVPLAVRGLNDHAQRRSGTRLHISPRRKKRVEQIVACRFGLASGYRLGISGPTRPQAFDELGQRDRKTLRVNFRATRAGGALDQARQTATIRPIKLLIDFGEFGRRCTDCRTFASSIKKSTPETKRLNFRR